MNVNENPPPHDIEAEQAILGAMMLSTDALDAIAEIVQPRDFYRPIHQAVFDAIAGLREKGIPADGATVAAALAESGDLMRVGGVPYLHTLIECVPTAANGAYYARTVADRAVARRLVEAGARIMQLGYQSGGLAGGGVELGNAVDLSQKAVYDITPRGADDYAVLGDMLQPTLDDIEAAAGANGSAQGVPTGFSDLDRLLNGLHPGQLIIVAGRPGLGKSTAAMDFVRNAALRSKEASAFFSLEMSKIEMIMRLLSAEARVPLHVLRSGQLTDDDWTRLARRMAEIGDSKIFVDDTPAMGLAEIRAKARRLKQRHDLKLLVVDYLQLMTSPKRTESRQQEVSDLSRGLKLLAKELGIPVIAVSQLNRGPENRQDKRPQLSDLRESGCMPASTRLLRADSGQEITLGQLVLSQEQPEVLSVDSRLRLVSARLTNTFPSGIKPVFRMRLASGREVDATANHKFLTIDGWSPLGDLDKGSFIATPRSLPLPAQSAEWSDDHLVLLAHLLGDGSIGPGVKYATIDPANKQAVEDSAKRAFDITVESKMTVRTWQMWLPSPYRLTHGRHHPIYNWLEPHGLWGSRSGNKFIPEEIFGLDDRQLALFLRHLWATDGSITMGRNQQGAIVRIYYATTSQALADNVQRALLRFAVRSRISPSRKKGYGICWSVVISGSENQSRFIRRVGCHGARGEIAEQVLPVIEALTPNPNIDLVPQSVAVRVKAALAAAGIPQRALAAQLGERYCGSYLLGNESRPRRFARARLERIAKIVGSQELRDIATSDVYWDEIVEVTPLGLMPTFDATVQGTHNFIANGVVAHNSIEQDADVVILLHRDDYYDKESVRAGEADFIVAKHRNGPTDTITVAAQLHLSRFVDMAIS